VLFGGVGVGPARAECPSFGYLDHLRAVPETTFADKLAFRLHQTQLAGTRECSSAPWDLELVEASPVVSFDRVRGAEQLLANLLIRASLGNEVEYLQLALAE
jgi:hypothetical protein